jgi:hypothetical protein
LDAETCATIAELLKSDQVEPDAAKTFPLARVAEALRDLVEARFRSDGRNIP